MAKRRTRRTYKKRVTRTARRSNRRLRSPFLTYRDPNPSFVNSRRLKTYTYGVTKKQKTRRIVSSTQPLKKQKKITLPYPVGNQQFRKAIICAKRQQRKEVLHAKKRTGKSGQRSPRYNQHSKLHCTR